MSLTRFLPTPSDRMGILWSLLGIEGLVVLEYGPAGTTHFSMGLFGELGEDQQNRIFTTHMSEDDVVMGDVTRLEKAIVEIDRNFAPKVIVVVSSSVAAVIGSDIKGVCSYMQEKVNAHLLSFEQGGFRGDYSVGLLETNKLLVQELVEDDAEPQEDMVNILGFSMGAYRALSDRREISYMLARAFGLKVNACLCGETSIDEIEKMGCATVNLVLREEAVPAAQILKKKFGTPVVAGMPYGYKGTLEWLEKISEAIGKPINKDFFNEINERIRDTAHYPMYAMMLKKDKPSATLVGEYRTIVGISKFLEEVGIPSDNKLCIHTMKNIPNADETVIHCESEKARLDILKSQHRSFILADDPSMSVCADDNVFMRISMPVVRGRQFARHMPLMGIHGADFIMETVEEYWQLIH